MNSAIDWAAKLVILICTFVLPHQSWASEGGLGNLIEDVELRTQYDFDQEEYNNAIRIRLGSPSFGAKNTLLKLERGRVQNELHLINVEMQLEASLRNEKIKTVKIWRKNLKRSYQAYLEYLKSNPSAARSSIDIEANEFLILAAEDLSSAKDINIKAALTQDFDMASFKSKSLRRHHQEIRLVKKANASERNVLKFVEFGSKGKYTTSEENSFSGRLAFSLPLGFTGDRTESRHKQALDEYKIKTANAKLAREYSTALREFKLKKALYMRLMKNKKTLKKISRVTSSSSIGIEDKVKIFIDAVKFSFKLLELKYEIAYLHQKMVSMSNESEFLGGL